MPVQVSRAGGWLSLSFSTRAAPEEVFDYLADPRRHAEWAGTLGAVTQTSDGAVAVGATFRAEERMREGGKAGDVTFSEITALERPRHIAWKARTEPTSGPLAMRSEWEFLIEPDGGGSRVTQRMRFDPPNAMSRLVLAVFRPVADLMGGMGASPKMVRKNVERLEEKLDAMAGRATAP
jgi:uncharacterized protein YndB with AHSA1/START domain